MRLALNVPPLANVQLAVGALRPCPDDLARWTTEVITHDLPPGARVDVRGFEVMRTRTGWPCDVVMAVVVLGEEPVEARLAACYRFREYAGAALARAASVEHLEAARPVLRDAFQTGRPDWGAEGTVVCLRDLVVPRP